MLADVFRETQAIREETDLWLCSLCGLLQDLLIKSSRSPGGGKLVREDRSGAV